MPRPAPKHSNLQNVQWRFLSDQALGPTTVTQPWSDESKKRISHLEKALASTHDLEAQYQSFLQEVAKIDPSGTTYDGVGPGWAGLPASRAPPSGGNDADMIPSDPADDVGGFASAPLSAEMSGGAGGSGGAPAPNEHVKEDEEVARVQMLAATAAGDSKGDEPRDSPSPVIIWRHAAPVKIATNVPSDLLTEGERAAGQRSRRLQQSSLGRGAHGGGATSDEPPAAPLNPAKVAYNRRMAYGVWYLPKEQWESRAQAAGDGLSLSNDPATEGEASAAPGSPRAAAGKEGKGGGAAKGAAKGGKGGAAGAETEAEGQSLADTIPKLYSSRIYKDFLRAQKVPNSRIPSYLQRVDSPKAQLSSRRGNIPMIEKGDGPDSPSAVGF